MANKKNTNKKTDNKQNIKKKINPSNEQKRNFEIIGFICSIILLVLILFGILKINSNVKTESNNIMVKYEEAYSSEDLQIIYYYNSTETDNDENDIELKYLIQLSKDYNIDYLEVDISKLNDKNRQTIENQLGITGTTPSIVIVKNKKIVAVQEGFVESHNLVKFFIKVGLLDDDAKFSTIDNLTFIDYNKYLDLLDSEDNSIIIVGKAACKYCISVKPILNNISKAYKTEIYYLDLSDLEVNDAKEFFEKLPELGYDNEKLETDGVFSTPTLLIIKNGKISSYLENARSLEEYVEYLKENEMIE